jgi:hypothetical protein
MYIENLMEVKTMFNSNTPFTMPVAPAYANNGGLGGFGDDWIGLIVILAILGWGGNGFGFGGFGGGNGYNDVQRGFDHNSVINKLDGLTYGLSDSTYALNNAITNGFSGVQATLCQGFNGVDRAIADCCCTTQRAIDGVNYNMATQACDIKHAINDSTRSILDFLTTDKIATLQAENQSLKFKASQAEQNAFITANQTAQTAELIRRLGADAPVPAYVVPNPNCCYNPFGFNFNNNGCGCA